MRAPGIAATLSRGDFWREALDVSAGKPEQFRDFRHRYNWDMGHLKLTLAQWHDRNN